MAALMILLVTFELAASFGLLVAIGNWLIDTPLPMAVQIFAFFMLIGTIIAANAEIWILALAR